LIDEAVAGSRWETPDYRATSAIRPYEFRNLLLNTRDRLTDLRAAGIGRRDVAGLGRLFAGEQALTAGPDTECCARSSILCRHRRLADLRTDPVDLSFEKLGRSGAVT
jgi:hypothetical protein